MSSRPSPLPNRVTPFGEIVAHPSRGAMFGNRGGRIHRDHAITRRQASPRWICCVLRFKGRKRRVMGAGYTELFFLDEATAFAAGHRPCFECRRADAKAFAAAWAKARGLDRPAKAGEMDAVLKTERPGPGGPVKADALAPGAMVAAAGEAFLFDGAAFRRWRFDGYGPAAAPPAPLRLLTPASALAAFRAGYRPSLHPSAHPV